MRAALLVTEHKLACKNFEALCDFLKYLGLKLMDNDLYKTSYGYYEILKTFSEVISSTLIEKIKQSQYFSIIVDESTDASKSKELL